MATFAIFRPRRMARWKNLLRHLLDPLDQMTPKIQGLTRELEEEVEKRPVTRRLMTRESAHWRRWLSS